MINIVFYFQVHQPYRVNNFNVLDIGENKDYFDGALNREIIQKVANKCYLPANSLILDLIDKYEGKFKVSYSITGVVIEQFKKYAPEVLDSFKQLAKTNCVEFLGETYYHSLSYLYDRDEFQTQIDMHKKLIQKEFGFNPITFRNTELIYQDNISDFAKEEGYKVILAEGAKRVLDWRSPLYAYKDYRRNLFLLLKYYSLSDDIAFRFSDRSWPEYPLTVDKFLNWVNNLGLDKEEGKNLFLNLFMDYETFGEHQWEETGIFNFLKKLPEKVMTYKNMRFSWPSDVLNLCNYEPETLFVKEPVSWADQERDLSAWMENSMQQNALETYHYLLDKIKKNKRDDLLEAARKLSTSDHFYYMSTKYFQDGDVHKYFSPYKSPELSYIYYINVLTDLEERL
ncbi:MAG: alpha-amylase [Candidatus Mcinerneyibacterium aminivorans]|uniref:Alpha-amylase n=1 Tax=Candidatus Mcinerneyibacterium aminivorans TaxID=2703815 RepID=A0A5D0MDT0_9BACT|nr:MAG: alpha-amylase [Candidatus Mcinerneyibacterium aminivorans]